MNNYHLFLIRSDTVTQIAAHLLAGIIALVFIAGLSLAQPARLPEAAAVDDVAAIALPVGTPMLATTQ